MTNIITTADAKEKFFELLDRVAHNKERIVLTRRGKEIIAMVPIEDLHQLQALEDKNDLHEATHALKQAREHGTISLQQLKEESGNNT